MRQIRSLLVPFLMVSLEFFIDIKSFRSHYGPGFDSASNRNEYQECFLVGKGGQCVRLTTLPPSCAVVTNSGDHNFLGPSGPLQASNGTDSRFYTFCVNACSSANIPNRALHVSILFLYLTLRNNTNNNNSSTFSP